MSNSGIPPVKTIGLLRRKPEMSFQEFCDYWRDVHAPLAAKVPGIIRYVQRHLVPSAGNNEPDNDFGIDGIAIIEYESQEAMNEGWASESGQAAMADVINFVGTRSVIVLNDFVVIDTTKHSPVTSTHSNATDNATT